MTYRYESPWQEEQSYEGDYLHGNGFQIRLPRDLGHVAGHVLRILG